MIKYFFIIYILIYGCKTNTPASINYSKEEQQLRDTIKFKWSYNSAAGHYVDSTKGFFESWNENNEIAKFIQTKDTTYVIYLFGKHYHIENKNQLVYNLTPFNCNTYTSNEGVCRDIVFVFDKNSNIVNCNYRMSRTSINYDKK